jgi:OHCU decarboxylase
MNGNAAEYDLITAATLAQALTHVAAGRRPIAGGTDLMVLFEAGNLRYRNLVDVRCVPELRSIEVQDAYIEIGAGVTYSQIREHPLLQREFGLLCQAASWTGGIANQNRGTLGGNIMNASPAADSPPALLVYDAEVELTSVRGSRPMPYENFHTGYKTMRMETDELLTHIRCPRPRGRWVEYGRKVGARKAQAISKLAIAAVAQMDGDRAREVRIALASVAPTPLRCRETERVLTGNVLDDATRERARETLKSELRPIDDIRSTAEYRRHVAANLLSEFMDLLQPRGVLAEWNQLEDAKATDQIKKCCGSEAWAVEMTRRRPFADDRELMAAADGIWTRLSVDDKLEAFRAHPKIGAAVARSAGWASREQSGMNTATDELRRAMAEGNREYESKFGFIYIVCATGKTAEQMLELLQCRVNNDRDTELAEASEQQRQIMQLRLRKWLAA